MDDAVPLMLSGIFAVDGIAQTFAGLADPRSTAKLGACSRDLACALHSSSVWAALLTQHFQVSDSDARDEADPRRMFAQRAVCARWKLSLPPKRRKQRSLAVGAAFVPAKATVTSGDARERGEPLSPQGHHTPTDAHSSMFTPTTAPLVARVSSWSPDSCDSGDSAKENVRPHELALDSDDGAASSEATSMASAASHWLSPPTISRLRRGLQDVLLSGREGVSACPVQPGDWSLWSARVKCSSTNGSPFDGVEFQLRVSFPSELAHETEGLECDASTDAQTTRGLPQVHVLQPECFHPNVDRKSGLLCAKALGERCLAADLIGVQLAAFVELVRRPVFSVPPTNAEASAMWYGDPSELRRRVAQHQQRSRGTRCSPACATELVRILSI